MEETQVEPLSLQELLWCNETVFEKAVDNLNLRDLLQLVTSLQEAMSEEQQRFDKLSNQLQDLNSVDEYQRTRTALYNSQIRLAVLCNKNMHCFTHQQAIRTKRDQWKTTKSSSTSLSCRNPPLVTIQKMATPNVVSSEERSASGFRESLRFFQKQETEESILHNSISFSRKIQMNSQKNKNNSSRLPHSAPSVDIILSNVRNICATKSEQNMDTNLNESIIKYNGNSHVTSQPTMRSRAKITPIIHQPRNAFQNFNLTSEQVFSEISNSNNNNTEKGPLSSRFNPKFEPENENVQVEKLFTKNSVTTSDSFSASFEKITKELSGCNSPLNCCEKNEVIQSEKLKVLNILTQKTKSNENSATTSTTKEKDYVPSANDIQRISSVSNNPQMMRDTNELVPSKGNHVVLNGNSVSKPECTKPEDDLLRESKNKSADVTDTSSTSEKDSTANLQDDVGDDSSEKACNSLDSDYDSKDFIVHKTSFSEDYIEVMSEDACSSITEDYEVEHPDDFGRNRPDIPSPDYVSEDEDRDFRVHRGISHYDEDDDNDEEFIDNSSHYMTDHRRYVYYPEDKELEVIPEEDEEDLLEEDDSYSPGYSDHDRDDFDVSFPKLTDGKVNTQIECDSGVTDDQRSTSSGVDDFYLEDDTDSAKGSLQLGSSSESPVQSENLILTSPKDVTRSPIPEKWSSRSWDMTDLLAVLYSKEKEYENYKWPLKQRKEGFIELISCTNERLPMSTRKFVNNYLSLNHGSLSLHEGPDLTACLFKMSLIEGQIINRDDGTICVRHKRKEIVFRPYTSSERTEWLESLKMHVGASIGNHSSIAVDSSLTIFKDVLVVDVGGTSIRAGILSSSPTLPALFFPAAVTVHKTSGLNSFGTEALHPSLRLQCDIYHPFSVPDEIEFRVEMPKLLNIIRYICIQLNIEIQHYKLLLCMGIRIGESYKCDLARTMLNNLGVKSICVIHETIAALHGYQQNTGIVVDAGDRIDVFPIVGGYLLSHNLCHSRFGARCLLHHLRQCIARVNDISLDTEMELYITRYILEQLCYVCQDNEELLQQSRINFKSTIKIKQFFQNFFPQEFISLDVDRFQVPEGLFQPSVWGYDTPGISELFRRVYVNTPLDDRKELVQNVFLSGGLTLLPGFPERLEKEISKFTPPTITPKVHASKYRYHMSYIGCHHIASSPDFEAMNVTWRIFERQGTSSIAKWKI